MILVGHLVVGFLVGSYLWALYTPPRVQTRAGGTSVLYLVYHVFERRNIVMLMKHLVVHQVVLVVMLKRNIERVLYIVVEDNDVQFE